MARVKGNNVFFVCGMSFFVGNNQNDNNNNNNNNNNNAK